MSEETTKAILNLCIANGNLQSALMLDNPNEILKAVHFITRSQDALRVFLYTAEQLQGMENMAIKRMAENKAIYLGDIDAIKSAN